jgi:DNA-binding HxlR family transcriptional regulator
MTHKEKAKELFFKYRNLKNKHSYINNYNATKCALIAVDEILNDDWYITTIEDLRARDKYWNEVKKEIEKL